MRNSVLGVGEKPETRDRKKPVNVASPKSIDAVTAT